MLHFEVLARFIILQDSLQDTAELIKDCNSFIYLKLEMAWLDNFQ